MHRLKQALKQALDAQLNAATAGNAAATDRHFRFLVGQLAIGTIGLAAFPVWLALDPSGSVVSSLAFLWLLAPIAIVVIVLHTGRLGLGQLLADLALTGLVSWIVVTAGAAASPLLVLFAIVPLACRLGGSGSVRRAIVFALVGLGASLLLAAASGVAADWAASLPAIVVAGMAIVVAGWKSPPRIPETGVEKLTPALIEESGDLITRHSEDGDVRAASRMAKELLGVEPDLLHGRGLASIVHIEDRPHFDRAMHDACLSAATVRIAYRVEIRSTDKPAIQWVETTFRRTDEATSQRSIIGVTRRIADRHSLGDGDRSTTGVPGAAGDEIEAALRTLSGFAELLAEPYLATDSHERKAYARLMRLAGEQLAGLINDPSISLGTKAERNAVANSRLSTMAREAVAMAASANAIQIDVPSGFQDAPVDAPADACTRVILIALRAMRARTAKSSRLEIAIGESGIGVRLTIRASAPQPFVQYSSRYNDAISIVDFGLSESARIVAGWGGELSIQAQTQSGPIVTLDLPSALPGRGGDNHNEELWSAEVRKSA